MTEKTFFTSLLSILLISGLGLSGCQVQTATVSPTLPPAAGASTTPEPQLSLATETPTPTVVPTVQLQANAGDLKGLVIEFWHPWSGDTAAAVEELVREYNRTNPWAVSVTEHAQGSSGELFNHLKDLSAEERRPVAVAAPLEQILSWQTGSDQVVDLNDYIPNSEFGLTEQEIQDFTPAFWQQNQVEGKQLGLPAQSSATVLFYNQSWAKELGFERSPRTPEEFSQQACAAAQANMRDASKDNDGSGGWIINVDPLSTLSWFTAFGGGKTPDASDAAYQFDTPENVEALQFMRTLLDQGCAWSARSSQPYDYFGQRMALFYSGTLQDLPYQTRDMQRLNSADQWSVIRFPAKIGSGVALSSNLSYAVLRGAPAEDLAAWLFIRWMAQPEHQARLAQTNSTLPLSATAAASLSSFQQSDARWAEAVKWIPEMQFAPRYASWRTARNVLEDAAWQAFQATVKAGQLEQVLTELDQTIADLAKNEQ